jgi:hypothetical protein
MPERLAINGFGPSGRVLPRSVLAPHYEFAEVAIGNVGPAAAPGRLSVRGPVHAAGAGRLAGVPGRYDTESGCSSRLLGLAAFAGAAGR